MRRVYKLWVVCVPTNRPVHPQALARPRLSERGRQVRRRGGGSAAAASAGPGGADRHALGGQVGEAERTADARRASSIRCSTPARHEQEAKIVAEAGRAGQVTIATNMAGRGTDIKPGAGRDRGRRPARAGHRAARGAAHRPPADGPVGPPGRPRQRPVLPVAGRRAAGRSGRMAASGVEEARPARRRRGTGAAISRCSSWRSSASSTGTTCRASI